MARTLFLARIKEAALLQSLRSGEYWDEGSWSGGNRDYRNAATASRDLISRSRSVLIRGLSGTHVASQTHLAVVCSVGCRSARHSHAPHPHAELARADGRIREGDRSAQALARGNRAVLRERDLLHWQEPEDRRLARPESRAPYCQKGQDQSDLVGRRRMATAPPRCGFILAAD